MGKLSITKSNIELMVLAIIFFSFYKVSDPTMTPSSCANCGVSAAGSPPPFSPGLETKTMEISDSDWTVDSTGAFWADIPAWWSGLPYPPRDYSIEKIVITYKNISFQLAQGQSYPIAGGMIRYDRSKLYFTTNVNNGTPALLVITVYLFLV